VPRALANGINYAQLDDAHARAYQFTREAPQLIANAFQLVLGFVLFLKSRTFATAWWCKQQPKQLE
jgi:hypothetical protein